MSHYECITYDNLVTCPHRIITDQLLSGLRHHEVRWTLQTNVCDVRMIRFGQLTLFIAFRNLPVPQLHFVDVHFIHFVYIVYIGPSVYLIRIIIPIVQSIIYVNADLSFFNHPECWQLKIMSILPCAQNLDL